MPSRSSNEGGVWAEAESASTFKPRKYTQAEVDAIRKECTPAPTYYDYMVNSSEEVVRLKEYVAEGQVELDRRRDLLAKAQHQLENWSRQVAEQARALIR